MMELFRFIHIGTNQTFSKRSDNLLQPRSEPATGPLQVLPGEVAEDLHDGVDQELLSVVRGPIGISLSHIPNKIVQ
jgi:hypothetical protein